MVIILRLFFWSIYENNQRNERSVNRIRNFVHYSNGHPGFYPSLFLITQRFNTLLKTINPS